MAKKFRLKANNLLLGHEDSVQSLGHCQGRALLHKPKLSIHSICPASGLTARELKMDWHGEKQPTLDAVLGNAPGIDMRDKV
ncbi:oligomeric Golgi complex subunit 6-like [Pyrus ussuriensis x Pyrus communis]|uniref:Oligomeric Golgi complex subunit 6-like n=1 Tax=Pyrus ussuriensis x Pyrus communis TaxID=2448454 RepID=A0A5N5GTC6_9ROSA|nr:oligomeric Golgi complex subunit 6-like [Pyrus ussuriensis x Pyrus communis]